MRNKIIVTEGQNIVDVAIREYGAIEALIDLCIDNNLAVDSTLQAGQELIIDDIKIRNKSVVDYFKRINRVITTGVIRGDNEILPEDFPYPILNTIITLTTAQFQVAVVWNDVVTVNFRSELWAAAPQVSASPLPSLESYVKLVEIEHFIDEPGGFEAIVYGLYESEFGAIADHPDEYIPVMFRFVDQYDRVHQVFNNAYQIVSI